jgi:multicomponent Na+:H+ antiporter subunit F
MIMAAMALLLGAAVLVMVRLWRGPTIADRALALDLLGFVAIGIVALIAVQRDAPALFDAAMALALIAFLATIALARYAEASAPAAVSTRVPGPDEDRGLDRHEPDA